MKCNISSINADQFQTKRGIFCGEEAVLIIPSLNGTVWNIDNLHFRSSIWSLNGELLSPSLKKFMNLGENIDINPTPNSLDGWSIFEKVDGSLLCLTAHNGQINIRSRGTFNANSLENGWEFYELLKKYPEFKECALNNPNYSFIFEIVTPNQKIIVHYPELDFYLLHIIDKTNYLLSPDTEVDLVAHNFNLNRPKKYQFNSFLDLVNCVKEWPGSQEGVVIRKDQQLIKIKSLAYLRLHAFKSNLSLNNLLEIYLEHGRPDTQIDFLNLIEILFDFECREFSENLVIELIEINRKINDLLEEVKQFVEENKNKDRKTIAFNAQKAFKDKFVLVFELIDRGQIGAKSYKKLFNEILKN